MDFWVGTLQELGQMQMIMHVLQIEWEKTSETEAVSLAMVYTTQTAERHIS